MKYKIFSVDRCEYSQPSGELRTANLMLENPEIREAQRLQVGHEWSKGLRSGDFIALLKVAAEPYVVDPAFATTSYGAMGETINVEVRIDKDSVLDFNIPESAVIDILRHRGYEVKALRLEKKSAAL